MTLRLTPDNLAAAYDYLRTTDPFITWKLPKSGRVKFRVIKDPRVSSSDGRNGYAPYTDLIR